MPTITDNIIEAGFAEHVLTDNDLEYLVDGTHASRYALVNKAFKKRELIRVRRGLYLLTDKYRRNKISKFFLASRIVSHSYISLESALSYHGWIPEYVATVTSVTTNSRTRKFKTPFGEFAYYYIPINEYEFLNSVSRVETIKTEPFFIASPLRALVDYVYVKKIRWENLDYLTKSLRIDIDHLTTINSNDFSETKKIYRAKNVLHFIDRLEKELKK